VPRRHVVVHGTEELADVLKGLLGILNLYFVPISPQHGIKVGVVLGLQDLQVDMHPS
jgi:hypothetical protein